ncbi:MAG: acetate--CoA ligase family protein [Candidatus Micrarchaeaceae archaeon]
MALLDYFEAKRILDKYGIRSVESAYVGSAEEAERFAAGAPIVLKLISDKALHKSKSGLVRLNLADKKSIDEAFSDLLEKGRELKPYKIIAQKMAAEGVEIIVGSKIDSQFGKAILLGLGGIYVETFKDFSIRICPITKRDALSMIDQLKSKNIITYNGLATDMLATLLLSMSKLVTENEISEIDLNPVIIRKDSYDAVDIRMLK